MPLNDVSGSPEEQILEFPVLPRGPQADDPEALREEVIALHGRLKQARARLREYDGAARAYRGERELYRSICNHMVSLGGERSLGPFLEGALQAIHRMTRAERGCIVVYHAGAGGAATTVLKTIQFAESDAGFLHDQISGGIIGEVRTTGRTVHSRCAVEDDQFRGYASVHRMALRSVLCVPIPAPSGGAGSQVLGALYLDNRHVEDVFSQEARQAIELFGRYLGLWIDQHARGASTRSDDPTRPFRTGGQFKEVVGRSPAVAALLEEMDRIVRKGIFENTLITGETGTGKDLVARCLHAYSGRRDQPFVAINCAALPENLLESELFGSVAGAFTHARTRRGLLEEATGGVCFLDEIGELPLHLQAKLLRALQERRVRRVGSNREVAVDIWLMAATNRDLEQEVREGRFRTDLFYRLNVIRLSIPPLRDRPDDSVELARVFLQREVTKPYVSARFLSPEAAEAIRSHPWPGNARELEHAVQKAAVRATGPYVTPGDLDLDDGTAAPPARAAGPSWKEANSDFQRRYLVWAIEEWGPGITEIARKLGLHRTYLYKLLQKHGLSGVVAAEEPDPAAPGRG